MFNNYYGGFFTYKKDLVGYSGQDAFGNNSGSIWIYLFLVLAITAIVLLSVFLRKTSHKKIDIYLKVLAIAIPTLEVIKITVETYFDLKTGSGFNWTGLVPLYTCSLFLYTLPLAAFGKGRVKQNCTAFLVTLSIFAGLTNFLMPPILNTYPFFNFHSFVSLNFHFWMVFTGVFLIATKYYVPTWKDIFRGMVPLAQLSVIAIVFDYALKADYMLYYNGSGAPLLPDLANFFASKSFFGLMSLRFVYTIIVFLIYILICAIIVSVVRFICFIKGLVQKKLATKKTLTKKNAK